MTTPHEPDPTMPVPTGGEPTMPVPGGDATIPLQGETYGGGPRDPGGPSDDYDDEEDDNRRLWLIAGGILVLGLIVGIIIALLASGGDDETASTTSTSSSTTSSSTTTTTTLLVTTTVPPTTTPAGPQITQFTANQNPVQCPQTNDVTLNWSAQNAQSVTVSIDNPNTPSGNYPPSGSEQFPFECGNGPGSVQHTYYLRANGAGGQTTQSEIVVTGNTPPTTSTT